VEKEWQTLQGESISQVSLKVSFNLIVYSRDVEAVKLLLIPLSTPQKFISSNFFHKNGSASTNI